MMKKHRSRLEKLEREINKRTGFVVLYADPDQPGEYTERPPLEPNPGKRYTEADRLAMAEQVETLIIVEYIHKQHQ